MTPPGNLKEPEARTNSLASNSQVRAKSKFSAVRATALQVLSIAGRDADLLLAVALLALSTNVTSVLSSPTLAGQINFLDHSWAFDLVVKAKQHIWLGDKVVFTYGPLFQLASSEIVDLFSGSLGAYLRSAHVLPSWAGIVLTFLTGRLLLAGHTSWKRCFYLLTLVGFWGVMDVRFCFDFFAFAVALRYFDRVGESRALRWKSAVAASLILLMGFLISADTGVYAVAAFAIAGLIHLLLLGRDTSARRAVLLGGTVVGGAFVLLAALTAAVMPHAGFGFWTNTLETVSQYRWSLPFAMDKPVKWRLIGVTTVTLLVLTIGYRWKDPRSNSLVRRPAFFPAAIAFSLLTLQSAIVRSDWGHVFLAMLPGLALAGAVLMGGARTAKWNWRSDIPPVLAFVLTVVFSGPIAALQPKTIVTGFKLPGAQSRTCPPGMFFIDDTCLTGRAYRSLSAVSEYLRTHTKEDETVAIFPFENMYAAVARRPVAGGVLQNYQIAGERLTRLQLDGLERDRPRLAVYSADGLATFGVDGVPNLTRTPEVWLYLQSHFTKQAELAPGIAILARDDARAKQWKSEVLNLGSSAQSAIRLKQPIPVPFLRWCDDCDLLRLRLRVGYPFWWRVTKPASLAVIIRLADSSEKPIRVVVPPNETADLWIYPWDEAQLLRYFDQDEAAWRSGRPRAPVSSVSLRFERIDWLSTTPTRIQIYGVEGVRLGISQRE